MPGKNLSAGNWSERLRVWPQYLLPQHLLSRLTYRLTRCQWPALKNFLIRTFIRVFAVDMSEALITDYRDYRHFNDFFTRQLRPGARQPATGADAIQSPVDGSISQIGSIASGNIFQAKNHHYKLEHLLANNSRSACFRDGKFATLYLSPRDYHRIHMPLAGRLLEMTYVPGRLFAVNKHTVNTVADVFARNERVIACFETEAGVMAMVMVGAINVGSIETVWAGEITPGHRRIITTTDYTDRQIRLDRGMEMGRFNMGSTVILLFGRDAVAWNSSLVADSKVSLGMPLARVAAT